MTLLLIYKGIADVFRQQMEEGPHDENGARSENFAENSTFVCGYSVQVTATSGLRKRIADCSSPSTGYSAAHTMP